MLLRGPDYYPDLRGVLLRLRKGRHTVSPDINKMFLQVQVEDEDQRYLSF